MKTISLESFLGEEDLPSTSKTTHINPSLLTGGLYDSNLNLLTDETASKSLLITRDPKICGGEPIIRGTRILVAYIVEICHLLGWDIQRIRDEYPHLSKEQIGATLDYYENHTKEINTYLKEEESADDSDRPT